MRKKEIDRNAIFQPPRGAAVISGLSPRFILEGCKAGKIPHVMCGGDYRINMPLWLAQLDAESAGGVTNAS